MATQSKTASKKSAAPKKAATKAASKSSAPTKSEAKKKSAPKAGELVEFDATPNKVRGILQSDGQVLVNGILQTPVGEVSKVDTTALSAGDRKNLENETTKVQTFEEIGVPKHRIGENIHEQNPDLAADINRERRMQVARQATEPQVKQTLTGDEAEEALSGE